MRSLKRTAAAATLAVAVLASPPAVTATTVQFPDTEVTSVPWEATIGNVVLGVTNAAQVDLGGYTVVLDIEPQSGASGEVSFVGAGHAPDELLSSSTGPIFTGTGEFVFITDVTDAGTVPLVSGDLFSVNYSVAQDTHGIFNVTFLLSPLASELQDGVGDPIPTTFIGGTMTVALIPEPSSACLLAISAVGLLARRIGTADRRRHGSDRPGRFRAAARCGGRPPVLSFDLPNLERLEPRVLLDGQMAMGPGSEDGSMGTVPVDSHAAASVGTNASEGIQYHDFTDTTGLNLLGNASRQGSTLRLTAEVRRHRGAAWFATKQYLEAGFETTFEFRITNTSGTAADGFAFLVQNHSLAALGGTGSAMAYSVETYPAISNSLAVEFDTFGEWEGNHISVQSRGTEPNSHSRDASLGHTTDIPELANASVYTSRIAYVPGTLEVYLNDMSTPVLSVAVDLGELLTLDAGRAWVGFTAANGDFTEIHEILSWSLVPGGDDFGDAPAPYPTLAEDDGARHEIAPGGPVLGQRIDGEQQAHPDAEALGDDGAGIDDEDGVLFVSPVLAAGFRSRLEVVASAPGLLNAWIDFNTDGDWLDPDEQVLTDQPVTTGVNPLAIHIPSSASAGTTFGRFRLSSEAGLSPTGLASDGEVEDHALEIVRTAVDLGDAPAPYPTLIEDWGAAHAEAVGGPLLGASIDRESEGQPDGDALGDDATGDDDEDGVRFLDAILPIGFPTAVEVTVVGEGFLNAWIDFNDDGDWEDVEEQVFADEPVVTGVNLLGFRVPQDVDGGETFARVRVSTAPGLSVTGLAPDGEVEDYAVELGVPAADFGDAPLGYPSLLTMDGARHRIVAGGPILGLAIDDEQDGQPHANAQGDDLGGSDDEDGVSFPAGDLPIGFAAWVHIAASASALLNAWIDFNQDGDWTDPGEQVFSDEPVIAGDNPLLVSIPIDLVAGTRQARFRLSSMGGLAATGPAPDGEVEDYAIELAVAEGDMGDAPSPYPTLLANNGARHLLLAEGPILGALIDVDPDGRPQAGALGDDFTGVQDEDGVTFVAPFLNPGLTGDIRVVASADAVLNAWIDFSGDGDWLDLGEQILTDQPVVAGPNDFTIQVPLAAVEGIAFARFRLSTVAGLAPDGPAPDGEVEDYRVDIFNVLPWDFGDAPSPFPTSLSSNGARHRLLPGGPILGTAIDDELNGQSDVAAAGDDSHGVDDEDGVTFLDTALAAGGTADVEVEVTSDALLSAWMDFNLDGDWADVGERIFADQVVAAGINVLTFDVPPGLVEGTRYARFRLSTVTGLSYDGDAPDGEVEDYRLLDTKGPRVTGVLVNSTAWSQDFRDLAHTGAASGEGLGYPIPLGSSHQLDAIPWRNVDQITLAFDERIARPLPGLQVTTADGGSYAVASASYDTAARAATWTLDTPLGIERVMLSLDDALTDVVGNLLDGEWRDGDSRTSGDGVAGGEFVFSLNCLPGDVDQNGFVDAADEQLVRSTLGMFTGNVGEAIVENGSFERPPGLPSGRLGTGSTAIESWRVSRGNIEILGPSWRASDGERLLDLDGMFAFGGISQQIQSQRGAQYRLRFDLSGNPEGPPPIKRVRVAAAGQHADFTFDPTGMASSTLEWDTHEWVFTATATTTTIEFYSRDDVDWSYGNDKSFGPLLDNVTLAPLAEAGFPLTRDVDGNGFIVSNDVLFVRSRVGDELPVLPTGTAAATTSDSSTASLPSVSGRLGNRLPVGGATARILDRLRGRAQTTSDSRLLRLLRRNVGRGGVQGLFEMSNPDVGTRLMARRLRGADQVDESVREVDGTLTVV